MERFTARLTASRVKKGEVRDAALKSSAAYYHVVKSTASRSKEEETNEVRDEGPKSGASFYRLIKSTASNVKKGEVRDAALKSSGAFYRVVKSTASRVKKEKQMKCGMRDRNPVLHFAAWSNRPLHV